MDIISLNIRHGGGNRIVKIQEYLLSKNPDIIILPEFRLNKNSETLFSRLSGLGYSLYFSDKLKAASSLNKNSVAVFSKLEFQVLDLNTSDSDKLRIMRLSSEKFDLYPVYFANKQEKQSLYDFLMPFIHDLNKPSLFIGDFNTGLPYVDELGNSFYCIDSFKVISSHLIDIWRFFNKDKQEYTWFSNSRNGFRIDHAFCNDKLIANITNCSYDHLTREQRISDHSALLVELNI